MKRLIYIMVQVLSLSFAVAAEPMVSCPMVKINLERLSDLNIPRSGHTLFCAGGEMVVAGGHTSGFVPTPTAEYYKDGKWHLMQMTYPHDYGLAVALKSGNVLLAGGSENSHGIGQTFGVEYYHPDTHSFEGFTILDQKRALASAVEIDSSKVVVSGNWYADDAIEVFDGLKSFTHAKPVSTSRSYPLICRISADDVMLFGSRDTRGDRIDSIVIDRLKGEPFTVPFFDDWLPFSLDYSNNECGFIGDMEAGVYAYLLLVENRHDGSIGIAKVVGTDFSLLPTASPIPMEAGYGPIRYFSYVLADRQAQRGYVLGLDDDWRIYLLAIDYDQSPASLTLYYTDPLESRLNPYMPALTPAGDLMFAGGISDDNFNPFSSVYLIHLGTEAPAASHTLAFGRWFWGLLALLVLALLTAFWYFRRNRSRTQEVPEDSLPSSYADSDADLMQRLCQLIEKEQLFRNSELDITDVAERLNVNSKVLADSIKASQGITFIQFLNGYRVDYAKRLLHQNPDKKIAEICNESGFASERSFFRIFKANTGMTTQEWMNKDA